MAETPGEAEARCEYLWRRATAGDGKVPPTATKGPGGASWRMVEQWREEECADGNARVLWHEKCADGSARVRKREDWELRADWELSRCDASAAGRRRYWSIMEERWRLAHQGKAFLEESKVARKEQGKRDVEVQAAEAEAAEAQVAKATRALDEGKRRRAEQDTAALEVHRAKCRAGEAASCAAAAAAGAAVVAGALMAREW